MDPAILCQAYFVLGAAASIGGTLVPSFRENIMNYGSRLSGSQEEKYSKSQNVLERLILLIASIQVPHTWFTHYYLLSCASSAFWGIQLLQNGSALQFIVSLSRVTRLSMTTNQVILAWTLMAVQGARRLYESFTLTKPSRSKMWIGIWILGILYYFFMGIGIWIEGVSAMSKTKPLADLQYSRPSAKTLVAVPMFLIASLAQHVCHQYLASLKKYSLPKHPLFRSIICPHYTCECLIYLAIAIVSAPKGRFLNGTVFAGLIFVVSNLAVTADSTKKWYAEKFGQQTIAGRWKMVPYIF